MGSIVSKSNKRKISLAEQARQQREMENFERKQWVRLAKFARVFVAKYPRATPARLIEYFQHQNISLTEDAARRLLAELVPRKKK
jgi:N-acetyl-anhydromuramyl-L-alanine amidase AmpD